MSEAPKPEPTPLEARLVAAIRHGGPITVGEFMTDALCHQQHGYYATRDPFGRAGDFTTAPEISQLFGELVGAWLVHAWTEIGEPSVFNLVELGPGRGTLMADVLRVGGVRPGFLKAARLFLVEASGKMRYAQQRTLAAAAPEIAKGAVWADRLSDVPAGPTLILANEFFDCLPIRQFVRTAERSETPWRERLVGLAGDRLAFVLGETPLPDPQGLPRGAKPESLFETCEAGQQVAEEIAHRFAEAKGRALLIDYGHGRPGFGDTFQAVRSHAHWPVLASPGEADVTAHVDFSALSRKARAAGARVDGPVLQRDFLLRLGLPQRLQKVAAAASDEAKQALKDGAERLVSPTAMGELFKVMAISSQGIGEPAGFS
ncbi:class I SAM-dependent methyltransferase [Parvularcula dongshanensis]|uniref:NADH dehydrogenase [ubiquinone] 1 alpha subcomplex assembly factor 7 n=1 Tax=Parvularcula dongshanensis TaxID=1173995 RepID=A0A840I5L5_9PROT|nr:SAM-dependent methyltransferase [Parvularcula dongshanensis]MBB4659310.1 NADH dehydrogenase [ubiquinone] 1 alpha subcomplex assembly factor 7 [Parvularcula dongshanensis]